MRLNVVSEATADLLGTAAVQPLEVTRQKILNRGAIHQVLDLVERSLACLGHL